MHRLVFLVSILLYLAALYLPVYSGKSLQGFMALILGWMVGANDWATAVSWFANIFFFMGIIQYLKRKNPKPVRAMSYGVVALVLGLVILAAGKAFVSKDSSQAVQSFSMGTAFYAWLASFILLVVAAYLKSKVPAMTKPEVQKMDV